MGALLQNRLVASLTSQATIRSAGLPAPVRGPFVSGFRQAAASGLLTGGSGSAPGGTPGAPAALAAQLRRLGAEVFSNGYVLAMRWTMVMPIAVVVLAAAELLCHQEQGRRPGPFGGARRTGRSDGRDHRARPAHRLAGQSPGSSSGTAS